MFSVHWTSFHYVLPSADLVVGCLVSAHVQLGTVKVRSVSLHVFRTALHVLSIGPVLVCLCQTLEAVTWPDPWTVTLEGISRMSYF